MSVPDPIITPTGKSLIQLAIEWECDLVKNMLIAKNQSYGNSALEPMAVFSKASPLERLGVRIDDKINRIAKGQEYPGDDTVQDLIGYLILYRIARKEMEAS